MKCPNCKIECFETTLKGKPYFQCMACPFNHAEGEGPIDELYCWLMVQEGRIETLVAFEKNGIMMPAVTSIREMALMLGHEAQITAEQTGMQAVLKKFKSVEIVQRFGQ